MADLQFVVSALDKTQATLLKIAASLDKVGDKLDKLDGKTARIAAALEDRASGGLDEIERKRRALDGKKATVKVDIDKSLSDSLIQVTRLGGALKALAIPAAALSAAPQIAAIGSAAVTAVGAVGLLPAAISAAGLAAATASVSFGSLITYFTASSDKKKKEAYDALSASGQHLADVIKSLTPRFDELRHATQDAVFKGLAEQVKPLADAYLPALQREMVGVGRAMNVATLSVTKFFQQKNVSSDMTASLMSLRLATTNVVLAARPLAQVFVDVFATGAARLPALTKGLLDATTRFAGFVSAARQSGQLGEWIDRGVQTVGLLGRTVSNVGSILLSVFRSATTEGSNLVKSLAEVTGQVAAFAKSAQGQGSLTSFFGAIRAAIGALQPVAAALLPLFGGLVSVVGTGLVRVFQALGPPLEKIAQGLTNSLAPVLPDIAQSFEQILLALVPMIAPVLALIPAFDSIAQVIAAAAAVAAEFFQAMAGGGSAIFTAIVPLIRATAEVLTVLLHVIEPIAPALGVAAAGFLAFKTAAAGIGAVQLLISGFATKLADAALSAGVFTEKVTGSANAGERLATVGGRLSGALSAVGTALPIIALAAGAVALSYEQMRDKSDELATSVVRGQTSMSAAVAEHANRIQTQSMVMQQLSGETEAMGQGIGELTGQLSANSNQVDANAQAQREMSAEVERQAAALPPLEQAQFRVKLAQDAYNEAVRQFTANSPQAIAAGADLAIARDREKQAADAATQSEKSLGDQIVQTSQAAAAAANADVAYQQGLLNLATAQDRAAEAAKTHSAGSRELQQANLQVVQANLAVADAARRKAEADAVATGATNSAQIGAQAYKDELIRLAGQATGPTREALLAMANGTDTAKQAAATAEIQSRLYKDELGRLGAQATGPLAAALAGAKQNFDTLGGAHASAEQRALAQKAELQRLANMASGPVKQSLQQMADQVRTLPDGSFTVTGTGQYHIDAAGGVSGGGTYTGGILSVTRGHVTGVERYATGGVMPGYTPGRDVHTFRSATGGTLELSGGEAVMRPEWTQAVGPRTVHAMNAAARTGGAAGVEKFLAGSRYAGGGIRPQTSRFADGGILPHQRFAMGGDIQLNGEQPFSAIPRKMHDSMFNSLLHGMLPKIVAGIQAAIARAQSLLGGGNVSGNVGSMMAALRGRFPGLALISGFRPGAITATGNKSYHSMGRAVDVPPRADVFNWIKATYGRNIKELIFSPMGGNQVWNGQNHMYTGITRAMHWDHVHWAMRNGGMLPTNLFDQGGMLPTGVSLAVNNTGQPERVIPPAHYDGGGDLIAELRRLNAQINVLRGDVDHHGDNAAIASRLDVTNRLLASVGAGTAAGSAQYQRTSGELGPW